MTSDFPTKAEAKGSRKKKKARNPWAAKLKGPEYRQRIVKSGKSKNRKYRADGGSNLDDYDWDWDD